MIAPRIVVHATRPSGYADDGEVQCGLVSEDARVVESIDDRRIGFNTFHQAVELGKSTLEDGCETFEKVVRNIKAYAARCHDTSKKTITGEPLVHLLEKFLQPQSRGCAIVECGTGADVADIADVVVN